MSASEAERLSGPPPAGDDDPHTSQAVPDPGEASGPPALTAGQLSGEHLGRRVRVWEIRKGDTKYGAQGTLFGVEHEADLICEKPLCMAEDHTTLGTRRVYVRLHRGTVCIFRPEATVELLG